MFWGTKASMKQDCFFSYPVLSISCPPKAGPGLPAALQAEQACFFILPPPCPLRCGCATSFLLHDCFCSMHLSGSQKVEQALPFALQFFAAAPPLAGPHLGFLVLLPPSDLGQILLFQFPVCWTKAFFRCIGSVLQNH